jgi:hypothetical protein
MQATAKIETLGIRQSVCIIDRMDAPGPDDFGVAPPIESW